MHDAVNDGVVVHACSGDTQVCVLVIDKHSSSDTAVMDMCNIAVHGVMADDDHYYVAMHGSVHSMVDVTDHACHSSDADMYLRHLDTIVEHSCRTNKALPDVFNPRRILFSEHAKTPIIADCSNLEASCNLVISKLIFYGNPEGSNGDFGAKQAADNDQKKEYYCRQLLRFVVLLCTGTTKMLYTSIFDNYWQVDGNTNGHRDIIENLIALTTDTTLDREGILEQWMTLRDPVHALLKERIANGAVALVMQYYKGVLAVEQYMLAEAFVNSRITNLAISMHMSDYSNSGDVHLQDIPAMLSFVDRQLSAAIGELLPTIQHDRSSMLVDHGSSMH